MRLLQRRLTLPPGDEDGDLLPVLHRVLSSYVSVPPMGLGDHLTEALRVQESGDGPKGLASPGVPSLRRTSVPQALSLPVSDIPMSSSRVVKHEIVLPCDGDFMNICFGGQARRFAVS